MALPGPAAAVAALATHSLVAVVDGDELAFVAFGRGDHGRLGVRDAFGNSDIRDKATPAPVALPAASPS